jgi:Xaa-Pro aminopeptidase
LSGEVRGVEHDHTGRMAALRGALAARGADAFLVAHLPNIFYLCGFAGSAGVLLVTAGEADFFTDARYAIEAPAIVRAARVHIARKGVVAELAARLRRRKQCVAFESAHTIVEQQAQIARAAGRGVRWLPTSGLVEDLRIVKDVAELAVIRAAGDIAVDVFDEVVHLVRPGMRESDLAAEIEYRMKRKGAAGPSFPTIVASGLRSALPHARASEKRLMKNELVVLDLGAILRGYSSDITRTVFVGRAPARIRGWYQAVLEAQRAARVALRAGVTAGKVDEAARRVLRKKRLDRYFVHSTGHGLGIEVHEPPRLGRGVGQKLRLGSVVTIEPGVYVEGTGGIRIEDDFLVCNGEAEILTRGVRELVEL